MPGDPADRPNLRPLIDELRRGARERISAGPGDLNKVLEDTFGQVFMVLFALTTEIDDLREAVAELASDRVTEAAPGHER